MSKRSGSSPKILLFDIETAGVNALKSDLGFVIIFGYKWLHEKDAKVLTVSEEELHKFSDKKLLTKASALLCEADIVVGHFASIFDRRFINGRLLINGLPPVPPTKMRDTCLITRSVANFSSNRLKHLAKILSLRHKKLENNWPDAWFQVMRGNTKALKDLADYCKGDVRALEDLYKRLLPFDNAHPRMVEDRSRCGSCGGEVRYRGFHFAVGNRYRQFTCTVCGKWGRETKKYTELKSKK